MALAKWYKIDFHTHTPESDCFPDKSITPAMWLESAKDSGLNAVVVSDHNSVGFIEKIESIKHEYEEKNEFKVFYGIEVCVSADLTHILIIFDDKMGVRDIEDAVICCLDLTRDKWGNTEQYVTEDNLKKLCNNYGNSIFVIPAHFASNKGLGKSNIHAIKRYQEFIKFSAIEVRNNEDVREYNNKVSAGAINQATLITGSDNPSSRDMTKHSVEGFGKAFTWVKVSELSFEGLRQVFIDHEYRCINWLQLQEFGEDYNPNEISYNYISGMNFKGISHMTDLDMRFSPHLNCIVGGRGTGKSTIVDAINYGVGNEIDLGKCTLLDKTLEGNGSITTFFNFGKLKSYQINLCRNGKSTNLTVEDDSGFVNDYPQFKIDFYGQKEIFGLIGQSGSGKSTILRIIQGILKVDKGEINIAKNTEVAYIFQEFNLLYNKNVFDNVALPLILKKKFSAEKVEEVLKFVGLSDRKESFIASLSGGERQRVAIARALVSNPQLLLCDEVTASLDKSVKDEILDLFEEINKKYGTTILVVTHELEVVKRLCSRVAVIEKGKITDIFNVNQKDYEKSNKSYADYVREVLK